MEERIQATEAALHERKKEFDLNHGGTWAGAKSFQRKDGKTPPPPGMLVLEGVLSRGRTLDAPMLVPNDTTSGPTVGAR
jgi:hypothetical protein